MTSGVRTIRSGSASYSVADIVSLTEDGILRVPSFQRSFVWDGEDIRMLFDSLYRGFPIGTLLLWRRHGPKGTIQLGPIQIDVPEQTEALWVVDGQQRVTSLYGALSRKVHEVDGRFEVFFDLETERFVNPRRGVVPARAIPVREALETKTLLTWLRNHADELEPDDFDLADRLGGVFRDYKVPAYIVTENDQLVLREVFDRVNSAGKPISRAQVFHALFANDEVPGSPASVVSALKSTGFGEISENRIVQSLLGIRGGDVARDIRNEFSEEEDPLSWYDKTEQALTRTISFLRSQGVPHVLLMPDTLPLPILATFFHVHPEPSPWVLTLLSRWLWRGWVHGFGKEGGQTPVLRRAIRSIFPDKGNANNVPGEYEAVKALLAYVQDREPDILVPVKFRTDQAQSRLTLLSLASLTPLNKDGEPINIAKQFDEDGPKAVGEFFKARRSDAASRTYWPTNENIVDVSDESILKSHLISGMSKKFLADRNEDSFLAARHHDLTELVTRFLSSRLDVGGILRPPLEDLLVAGSEDE